MTPDRGVLWEQGFEADAGAAKAARMGVRRALVDDGLSGPVVDDALVVLSELVGNALRHAGTEFSVVVTRREGTLRIEVFDLDTRPPALLGLDSESTSGRGLHLVAGVATGWGWQTAEGPNAQPGKVVWAELAADHDDRRDG